MKKFLMIALVAMLGLMAMGCGAALHNTPASYVKLELVNFPNGDYDWRGAFPTNNWSDANKRKITVAAGTGSYTATDISEDMIIAGLFTFSIVDQTGAWGRSWFGKTAGNENDYSNGAMNFAMPVPMDGGTHTLKIDGATNPAKLYVDGTEVDNTPKDLF